MYEKHAAGDKDNKGKKEGKDKGSNNKGKGSRRKGSWDESNYKGSKPNGLSDKGSHHSLAASAKDGKDKNNDSDAGTPAGQSQKDQDVNAILNRMRAVDAKLTNRFKKREDLLEGGLSRSKFLSNASKEMSVHSGGQGPESAKD